MKKNRIMKIIFIVILVFLPFVLEFFISSWDISVMHGEESGNVAIDMNGKNVKKTEKTINGKFVRKYTFEDIDFYINKLVIKFESTKDNSLKLTTTGSNEFGKNEKKTFDVLVTNGLNRTTQYINEDIESLEIETNNPEFYIKSLSIKNVVSFNFERFMFFAFISIFIGICWYMYLSKKLQLEYVFLVLVLLVGSISIISIPKVSHWSPDSEIHFRNAYIYSHLGTYYNINESFNETISLPVITTPNTVEDKADLSRLLNKYEGSKTLSMENKPILPTFNQWGYMPYSAGMAMGRLLNLPYTFTYMLAKLFALIFYALMCFFAIKIAKKGKRLYFVLSLIPSMLFLTTQFSLDGIIFSSILLATSLFAFQYFDRGKKVTFWWTLAYVLCVTFGSLPKAIYGVFILLPLLFKSDKFKDAKQCKIFKISIGILFFMLLTVMILPMIANASAPSDLRGGATNALGQIISLISHPISSFKLFGASVLNSISFGFLSPNNLGSFYYLGYIPAYYSLCLFVTIIFLAITDWKLDEDLPKGHRILFLIFLLLMTLMIYGALYVSFTPVGLNMVQGVQMRYFLPLLPLFFMLPATRKIHHSFSEEKMNIAVISLTGFISFACIFSMIISVFCN